VILLPSLSPPGKLGKYGVVGKGGCFVEVPVIIEQVTGSGYRVTGAGGLSIGLTAEGATAAEAIDRLAEQVRIRVNAGAKLAELSVAAGVAPWKQDAGYLHDEPLYELWHEAMEDYRRKLDEDPEAL
jgi:hypothetical protein